MDTKDYARFRDIFMAWYVEGVCSSHICDLNDGEVSGKGAKYPRLFFCGSLLFRQNLRVTNHG